VALAMPWHGSGASPARLPAAQEEPARRPREHTLVGDSDIKGVFETSIPGKGFILIIIIIISTATNHLLDSTKKAMMNLVTRIPD